MNLLQSILSLLVSCTLLANIFLADATLNCPDGTWQKFSGTGSCYKLFEEVKTWDEANDHCIDLGAHLLTLESRNEVASTISYLATAARVTDVRYYSSFWFHVGIRRVESHRTNIKTYGTQGYTWVDGTILNTDLTDFLNWDLSILDNQNFVNPVASAVQARVDNGLLYVDFSSDMHTSLTTKEKYICKFNINIGCGPAAMENTTFAIKDSRMTPALCTAACLSKGFEGYAMIQPEHCYCSNSSIPSNPPRSICSTRCRNEAWLICGGLNLNFALFRSLSYYNVDARASLRMLSCDLLYSSGVVRYLNINGEECSIKMEPSKPVSNDLYCEKPDFFPLRTMCVHVSPENTLANYYAAQFDLCGRRAHSDILVPDSPRHSAGVANLYRSMVDSYGLSLETNMIIVMFAAKVMRHVPYLHNPNLRYILSGAVTHKMTDYARTAHGSLLPYWPYSRVTQSLQRPHSLVIKVPQREDYNLAMDRMRGISTSDPQFFASGMFNREAVVMCVNAPGYVGCRRIVDRIYGIVDEDKFTLVYDDPRFLNIYGCIELCRANKLISPIAYISNNRCLCSENVTETDQAEDESLCFAPCPDPSSIQQCPSVDYLARAFDIALYPELASSCAELWRNGAYHYGPYMVKSPEDEAETIYTYCNSIPQMSYKYTPLTGWRYDGRGGPAPSGPQLRPQLFSQNAMSFEGVGYHFHTDSKEVTIILPQLYLVRGIKTLGRGDYDIAMMDSFNLSQGYISEFNLSYYGLKEEWLFLEGNIRANVEHEEDLAVIALSQATVASRLRILVTNHSHSPVLRVELLGDPVGTVEEVYTLDENLILTQHLLGCYRRDPTAMLVPLNTTVREEALRICADGRYPYAVFGTHEDEATGNLLSHFSCHPGGRLQLDKVSDVNCEELYQTIYYEYFDTFSILPLKCPIPPRAPSGYKWVGVNLLHQTAQLQCAHSTNFEPYTTFTCLEIGQWDKDIYAPPMPLCAPLRCQGRPPYLPNAVVSPKDLTEDSALPGRTVTYDCTLYLKWENGLAQQAVCNSEHQWEFTVPRGKCVAKECPGYVHGFQNKTDNLHPDFARTDPSLYNIFLSMKWPLGSYKNIGCPVGTSLSNGERSINAYCSYQLEDWYWDNDDGQCISDDDGGADGGADDGGAGGDRPLFLGLSDTTKSPLNDKLPIIITVTVFTICAIACFILFTLHNSRQKQHEAKVVVKEEIKLDIPLRSRKGSLVSASRSVRANKMRADNDVNDISDDVSTEGSTYMWPIPPIVIDQYTNKPRQSTYHSAKGSADSLVYQHDEDAISIPDRDSQTPDAGGSLVPLMNFYDGRQLITNDSGMSMVDARDFHTPNMDLDEELSIQSAATALRHATPSSITDKTRDFHTPTVEMDDELTMKSSVGEGFRSETPSVATVRDRISIFEARDSNTPTMNLIEGVASRPSIGEALQSITPDPVSVHGRASKMSTKTSPHTPTGELIMKPSTDKMVSPGTPSPPTNPDENEKHQVEGEDHDSDTSSVSLASFEGQGNLDAKDSRFSEDGQEHSQTMNDALLPPKHQKSMSSDLGKDITSMLKAAESSGQGLKGPRASKMSYLSAREGESEQSVGDDQDGLEHFQEVTSLNITSVDPIRSHSSQEFLKQIHDAEQNNPEIEETSSAISGAQSSASQEDEENQENQKAQNPDEQDLDGQYVKEQNLDGPNMNMQDIARNQDGKNVDGQNMDKQNLDGPNIDMQNINEQNVDGQNSDGEDANEQDLKEQDFYEPNTDMQDSQKNQDGQDVDERNEDEQNTEEQNHGGPNIDRQNINEQNADGHTSDGQEVDEKHSSEQSADKQHADEQRMNGENAEGQNADEQHADEQQADEQHADEQHTDEQHTNEQHTDEQHTNGENADGPNADGQNMDGNM